MPIESPARASVAEREYVGVPRAAGILGADWSTVYRLVENGCFRLVDFVFRGRKRVHYGSLVEYLDRLRVEYGIPNRRAPLAHPSLRWRDEDLLPFPLTVTIDTGQAADAISISQVKVVHMCEEGRFESYHFLPNSPWRISAPSFVAYVERTARVLGPNAGSGKFVLKAAARAGAATMRENV